ncbi:MAG TPA: hypothetical protein VJ754_02035 [Anaerolineae bacterium]|nr:hypothetical protein [Anaerolineae bacterium]
MSDSRSRLFNALAQVLLILTVLVIAYYTIVLVAPGIFLNPFPPPARVAVVPTGTPGPTGTPTVTPTPTRTPRLTNTATRSLTPTLAPTLAGTPGITQTVTGTRTPLPTPTFGPPPTATPTLAPFNYVARVEYQHAIHYGVNWAGMAGYVLGLDRKHQTNIVVRAWGDAPLGPQGQEIASGIAPQWGISGFEFTLGDRPATGAWSVQLIGDDGQPLSDIVHIRMDGDPRTNLAFIWFEQNH